MFVIVCLFIIIGEYRSINISYIFLIQISVYVVNFKILLVSFEILKKYLKIIQ